MRTLVWKIRAGFALLLLLMLLGSAIAWRTNERHHTDAQRVRHSQQVINELTALMGTVTDGETGQRGYIITGNEDYLLPYQHFLASHMQQLQSLRQLTADNPVQQTHLDHLEPLLHARAAHLKLHVDLRREQGFDAAQKGIMSGEGNAIHNGIRSFIAAMQAEEQRLMTVREADTLSAFEQTRALLLLGILVVGLTIPLTGRQILRGVRLRQEVRSQLTAVNADLLVAMHRAQHADRIKSAFLATMSHELRTPLNSIIGFSGVLLQELAGPLNAEQKKQLGMVRDSSRHLLSLVNDVLDISKIEAEQLQVNQTKFALQTSLNKALAMVSPLAQKKGLKVQMEVAPDLGDIVSDPRRVEQILVNLLNNAVKFTDHGFVGLQAQRHLSGPTPGVRIQVSDSGIGIRDSDLSQLFQPFQQIDHGLSRNFEGTGLGLAISKRLLSLLGGSMEVQSELGKGSVFTIFLPLAGAKPS